jgi:hypothetical protein
MTINKKMVCNENNQVKWDENKTNEKLNDNKQMKNGMTINK